MKHRYDFIDVSFADAIAPFSGKLLARKYTRFQHGLYDGRLGCSIFWVGNEPHVNFLPNTPNRVKLEGTIAFLRQHPHAVVRTLESTKRLFDAVSKHTKLKLRRRGLDSLGRGLEYIYEVSHA